MPSFKKFLHFMSSALVTGVSDGLMGFAMSQQWATTTLECSRAGSSSFNGTAVIELKLFDGVVTRNSCPLFGQGRQPFLVFSKLVETGGAPVILHGLILGLSALCLLCSAGSILISIYNSVSNPYETYMGPIGIYVCSSLSACVAVLVLILYVLNLMLTNMAEDLVQNFAQNIPAQFRNKTSQIQLGYYLVIPHVVLSLIAIALIYMYNHAAYTHRREQQKPTEDAPKKIMMYYTTAWVSHFLESFTVIENY